MLLGSALKHSNLTHQVIRKSRKSRFRQKEQEKNVRIRFRVLRDPQDCLNAIKLCTKA